MSHYDEFEFDEALLLLKNGSKVARKGWNGKGMYIELMVFTETILNDNQSIDLEPCIMMFTASGKYQPGWLASQADLLADDWVLVDDDSCNCTDCTCGDNE